MAEDWTITGDYVEACNCDVVCQCPWGEMPDDDYCAISLAWNIQEGEYGNVDLSGISVAMLIVTEEGLFGAPDTGWDVVVLIDEQADDDQRAALEDIYLGRAGGWFTPVTDDKIRTAEVVTAPFTFTRDGNDFSVSIGDVISMEVGGAPSSEEPKTISPIGHAPEPDYEMQTGKSTRATVSYDDQFTWDVSENNAFFCDFKLSNA